jgi:acyl carrier protein
MTFEKIRDVIAFTLSRDKEIVRREARLKEDLEMDSFDYAELASTLEQEFGIDISDEEMAGWKTVSDVAACLQKKARKPSLPHAAGWKK